MRTSVLAILALSSTVLAGACRPASAESGSVVPPEPADGTDDEREPAASARQLDPALHHVGDDVVPDWVAIASADPEGADYVLEFEHDGASIPASIELEHRGVQAEWTVSLGDVTLGTLPRRRGARTTFFDVPPGALAAGANVLTVRSADPADDIVIGKVTLHPRSSRAVLDARHRLGDVHVRVVAAETGRAVPARVALVDERGAAPRLLDAGEHALRPGVAYTDGRGLTFSLPAGRYRVAATRGMEWSRPEHALVVKHGERTTLDLELRREVDTRGWVAADTHVHTLTFAGHGDALIGERMLSLAGEGVELAIATDHNHNVDYAAPREAAGMTAWFTPITGNEVTTPIGHFNAFPLDPEGPVPGWESTDLPTLVAGMRAAGARYVIVNHPHWPAIRTGPFAALGLDPRSAARYADVPIGFDAVEVINSTTLDPEPMTLFADWFALLNRGEATGAVGSSDSHTIGEPVGQGRTYARVPDDAPGAIDVDAAIASFERGATTVSLGIFATVELDGTPMGGTLRTRRSSASARVRVQTPSWITARRAHFVVAGAVVGTVDLAPHEGPRDAIVTHEVPLPAYDSWLTVVVIGDGVDHFGWRTEAPYTVALTNPVFVDRDGRSGWTPPIETARRRLAAAGTDLRRIQRSIDRADAVLRPLMHALVRHQVERMDAEHHEDASRAPSHGHLRPRGPDPTPSGTP